ncbi:insulinase family protein [Caldilinea sp.]|uniref:insulinase family protein n=1 Tax=Caldilinea sp. TaxID=2293560 RepID=UPI002BBC8307|nr:insulinase family protein [Caldilinea sp.]
MTDATTHGFELLRDEDIVELKTRARFYRHVKTGAEVLSLENDDENKVFGVNFRTPPADSTGIAHILEHSVLGGSQKYPLKEPFVQLIKGSLHTFLNAFTSPDKTTYPVASTNLQDFYNLVDVYLDAVFHPLITPHHLDQEGWHYELESPDAPLVYRGIVFNEMKGVYSSPDAILGRAANQGLFPDNAYGLDSGGDPRVIPQLTYAQFKAFHTAYYHPSNAQIFFYGDDDPTRRLEILDAVLSEFDANPVDNLTPVHAPFAQPRQLHVTFGADGESDLSRKSMVDVNWALPEVTDPSLRMALSVLAYAVIGAQASPLRKALVDSGLGEDVTGGLSGYARQPTFSVTMKGIASADAARVEALILKTLETLATDGIETDMIEAALNSIEFSLRENNTGSFPRGLSIFMRALQNWNYGRDPLQPLRYETPLAVVKRRLAADPSLLGQLIRLYLLDNPHRLTVVAEPDPAHNQQLVDEERQKLDAAKSAMSPAEIQHIIENTRELKARQQRPDAAEDLARLPSLQLSDLDRTNKTIPIAVSELAGGKLLYHDLFTNGILYMNLGFDLTAAPQELLPYVPFFGRALLEMGTAREDYVKFSQRIDRKTGGVWNSAYLSEVRGQETLAARFFVSAKATVVQTPDLFDILRDMLLTVKLDNRDRFRQIVLKSKARRESSLVPSGHAYVRDRLRAGLTTAGWADEQMDGIEGLFFVRRLAEMVEQDWPAVLEKLDAVRQVLIGRTNMLANVTLDAANWETVAPQLAAFVEDLPESTAVRTSWQPDLSGTDEGLAIPAQVNYVGKGANLYSLGYTYHGSIHVINNFVRTNWLWDKVRAEGGAYGAFANFGKQSGVYSFLSYRDPNLANTLKVYDQTAELLRTVELSDDELTKNIIGAISDVDGYQLPDAKGYTSMVRHLLGETDESRQQMRDQILATTVDDFRKFGEVLAAMNEQARVVVMGSSDALSAANEQGSQLKITRVM